MRTNAFEAYLSGDILSSSCEDLRALPCTPTVEWLHEEINTPPDTALRRRHSFARANHPTSPCASPKANPLVKSIRLTGSCSFEGLNRLETFGRKIANSYRGMSQLSSTPPSCQSFIYSTPIFVLSLSFSRCALCRLFLYPKPRHVVLAVRQCELRSSTSSHSQPPPPQKKKKKKRTREKQKGNLCTRVNFCFSVLAPNFRLSIDALITHVLS